MHIITQFTLVASLSALTTLTGCQNNNHDTEQSHMTDANTTHNNTQTNPDSTKPKKNVAILHPKQIIPLNLLLHPIVPVYQDKKSYAKEIISSYGGKNVSTHQASFNKNSQFHLEGHASNIVFEHTKPTLTSTNASTENNHTNTHSNKQKLFKHNNFLITDMFYPHVITTESLVCNQFDKYQKHCKTIINFEKNKAVLNANTAHNKNTVYAENNNQAISTKIIKQVLFNRFLYKVKEHNLSAKELKDVKGDLHKQMSLYISDGMGKNVKKLHPDDQFLTETTWMPRLKRYYFSTRSDSNANQIIDLKDKQYNYMIEFSTDSAKVTPYEF